MVRQFLVRARSDAPANHDLARRMLRQFSHRCRNTLSGIKLGLYVLRKELEGQSPSRWTELGRTCDEIEKLFDGLQRIYQSTSLTVVRSPLGQLFAERLPVWRSRYAARGRTILVDTPERDAAGDFDPTHLGRGLDAFVAWRADSSDSGAPRLAWRVVDGKFEISWQESLDRRAERAGAVSTSFARPLARRLRGFNGPFAAGPGRRRSRRRAGGPQRAPLDVTVRWPHFRNAIPTP